MALGIRFEDEAAGTYLCKAVLPFGKGTSRCPASEGLAYRAKPYKH